MNKKRWESLEKEVRRGKLHARFHNAPCVAILSGPTIVIEACVYIASKKSGIDMDWGFIGGRAFVYSLGDMEKSHNALCDAKLINL